MIGLYLAAMLFGGILVAVSLLGGSGHEAHVSLDHGGELHADHELSAPHAGTQAIEAVKGADALWLIASTRFWSFGLAAFGITGLLLTLFQLHWLLVAAVASPFGAAVGYAVAKFFRRVNTDSVSGDIGLERYVGQEARVVIPVRPGAIGKISLRTKSGTLEMVARSRDGSALEVGSRVLIAHVDAGTADVTSLPDPSQPHAKASEVV